MIAPTAAMAAACSAACLPPLTKRPAHWGREKIVRYWGLRAGRIAGSLTPEQTKELEALDAERAAETPNP